MFSKGGNDKGASNKWTKQKTVRRGGEIEKASKIA